MSFISSDITLFSSDRAHVCGFIYRLKEISEGLHTNNISCFKLNVRDFLLSACGHLFKYFYSPTVLTGALKRHITMVYTSNVTTGMYEFMY